MYPNIKLEHAEAKKRGRALLRRKLRIRYQLLVLGLHNRGVRDERQRMDGLAVAGAEGERGGVVGAQRGLFAN